MDVDVGHGCFIPLSLSSRAVVTNYNHMYTSANQFKYNLTLASVQIVLQTFQAMRQHKSFHHSTRPIASLLLQSMK